MASPRLAARRLRAGRWNKRADVVKGVQSPELATVEMVRYLPCPASRAGPGVAALQTRAAASIPAGLRISLTSRSDGVSGVLDLGLMPTPLGVTMSPKSSVPQAASFVSQVLMSDSHLGMPEIKVASRSSGRRLGFRAFDPSAGSRGSICLVELLEDPSGDASCAIPAAQRHVTLLGRECAPVLVPECKQRSHQGAISWCQGR